MAGLPPQASPVYCANKAGVNHFMRSMAVRLAAEARGRSEHFNNSVWCYSVCPTFTDTPLWRDGDPEGTRRSVGGVARVQDIVDALLDLIAQRPLSGSICRVTLRNGGHRVVRDLMAYGKELGGPLPAREGTVLGERLVSDAEHAAVMS